jgi:hypothetical protein
MRAEAFTGLAGDVIDILAPSTEADAAGLLTSFLVGFGAAVGPGPHVTADGAQHPARLSLVLVGASSRARKGTSWAVVRRVLSQASPELISNRVVSGIASGEGLVAELADREGDDRNVLVIEPEFARLLRTATRSASMSALLRQAWDGDDLAVLTRSKPLKVAGASVSLIGHITAEELNRRLDRIEVANGFGNRLLFCWVERAQRLPHGGDLPAEALEMLGLRVWSGIERARTVGRLSLSDQGRQRWEMFYNAVDDTISGVVGALTARAEAQVLRLAVTYALLEGSGLIEPRHIEAAEAVWDHCDATVHRVFGNQAHEQVATTLLAALRAAGPGGLDGSQQQNLFSRHQSAQALAVAREQLEHRGLARTVCENTGGRPRVVTRIVNAHGDELDLCSLSSPHCAGRLLTDLTEPIPGAV